MYPPGYGIPPHMAPGYGPVPPHHMIPPHHPIPPHHVIPPHHHPPMPVPGYGYGPHYI